MTAGLAATFAAFAAALVATAAAVLVLCALPPRSNHIGFEIRWLWLFSGFIFLYGSAGLARSQSRRWAVAIASFSMAAA